MMFYEILTAILTVLLTYLLSTYFYHLWQLKNYPPGPLPFPLIGNLQLFRKKKQHEVFTELSAIYGGVFSVSLGMERVVVINTIENTREALVTHGQCFSGRPINHYYFELFSKGYKDIGFADYNEHWKFTRKAGFSAIRMLNDSLGNTESKILKESDEMIHRLKEMDCKAVDVNYEIGISIFNVMANVLFGRRFEIDDDDFVSFMQASRDIGKCFTSTDPIVFARWLRFIYPTKNYMLLLEALRVKDRFLQEQVSAHKSTFDPTKIKDFTDSLLHVCREENNGASCEDTDTSIELILGDMIIAGVETTLTAISWMILYLIHYPDCQRSIIVELDSTIGENGSVKLSDAKDLHYLQAFIHESLRMSSFSPLGIPHKASERGTIGGFNIPKNSMMFFNLWKMHYDPRYWDMPNTFNPNRWFDENSQFNKRLHKSFLPFSIGKRNCIGEALAMKEIILFMSNLVKEFEIKACPDEVFPTLESVEGMVLHTQPFHATFVSRKSAN